MQGSSTTTFPFRGAAVFVPLRWMRLRREPASWPSSSSPDRLVPSRSACVSTAAARGRRAFPRRRDRRRRSRRGRPVPAVDDPCRWGVPWAGGRPARPPRRRGERAPSSRPGRRAFFFSSCLRMCSESGLVPALLARIASGGKADVRLLRSRFLGLGTSRAISTGSATGPDGFPARPFPAAFFSPGFFSLGLPS